MIRMSIAPTGRHIFLIISLLFLSAPSYADIAIKIVVENPSDAQAEKVHIKYDLPDEITPAQIKDTGGLKIIYNVKKGSYSVDDDLTLDAGEKRVLKLLVQDVWKTSENDIVQVKKLLKDSVEAIEEKEMRAASESIGAGVTKSLDKILADQNELESDIDKRIQNFKSSQQELRKIRGKIFSIEMLARAEVERGKGREIGTIKLVVEANNPTDQQMDMPLKYYLPADVHPELIVDLQGFDYRYDTEKNQAYLIKKESFAPKDTKKWTLDVKNVWVVPEEEINILVGEAERSLDAYKYSRYKQLAQSLCDEIKFLAGEITRDQKTAEIVTDVISIYKVNKKRLELMKEDLLKLQSLSIQDSQKKHNVLRDVKLPDDIKQLSDVLLKRIFKEGKISLFVMILGVIGFVVLITVLATLGWMKGVHSTDSKQFQNVRAEEKVKLQLGGKSE